MEVPACCTGRRAGSDIDHLVIGPPGGFTLNAKNHPGAKIWIGGDTFMVNGHRQPYVRNSRFETRRAAAATGMRVVAVGVIAPVGAAAISVKTLPADVKVGEPDEACALV